jgi:hypothetical protein
VSHLDISNDTISDCVLHFKNLEQRAKKNQNSTIAATTTTATNNNNIFINNFYLFIIKFLKVSEKENQR